MPENEMETAPSDAAWLALAAAPPSDGDSRLPVPLDPYMLWALRTGLRSLAYDRQAPRGGAAAPRIPPALEFVIEQDPTEPPQPEESLPFEIPAAYRTPLPDGQLPRFVTLRLRTQDMTLVQLQQAVFALVVCPGVLRLQLGSHRTLEDPVPASADLPTHTPAPAASGEQRAADPPADAPNVVLGVLEDGCPFAQAALRQAGGTRISTLWDQSSSRTPTPPWRTLPPLGYGAELTGNEMLQLMQRHTDANGDVDEDRLYADPDVDMHHLLRRRSHAAAVIGVLAGADRLLPQTRWPTAGAAEPAPAEDDPSHPPAPPPDAAGTLAVVAVQLPREQVAVTSGRWLAVKALDGLRYLMLAARRLAPEHLPPVLIANLSYGGHGGAHDGTGLFESAVAELCASDQRLAVVLAAGNSHGTELAVDDPLQRRRLPSGVHGRQLLEPGSACCFHLHLPPDKQFETYLELWFSPSAQVGGSPSPQPQRLDPGEVQVQVTAPDGRRLTATFPGIDHGVEPPLDAVAGLVCLTHVSQSRHRSMALLVVAATQNSSTRVEAPAGLWHVRLVHQGNTARPWTVDAWVERDDTTTGAVRGQAARLVDDPAAGTSHLDDSDGLSHRSQTLRMVTAGALLNRSLPGEPWPAVSLYSAAGADNASGPGFSALVDAGTAWPGMRAPGSQSGIVTRANGTSLAAPQVARWLANQLVRTGGPLDVVLRGAPTAGRSARRGTMVP